MANEMPPPDYAWLSLTSICGQLTNPWNFQVGTAPSLASSRAEKEMTDCFEHGETNSINLFCLSLIQFSPKIRLHFCFY